MTSSPAPADLSRFRSLIGSRLGLEWVDGRSDLLMRVFERRAKALGARNSAAYLEMLNGREADQELRMLAGELTVTETYFFRGSEHFRALQGEALPRRIRARGPERRLNLLSAGCASGEEAYSLAILLRESFPEIRSWQIKITGVDVNPLMVAEARKAKYGLWSLRETPPEIREKYFRPSGRDFLLDEQIRFMVAFEEMNLADVEDGSLSGGGQFDIVLCRNVLMYFTPGAARRVIERLTRALEPDGYLFLGYAENLRGLSHSFHLGHTHDCFYYQKNREDRHAEEYGTQQAQTAAPATVAGDYSWVEAVGKIGSRIEDLERSLFHRKETGEAGAPGAVEPAGAKGPLEPGMVLELIRQERFREALDLLDRLQAEAMADPDTQLLRAVLLANCGDLAAAEGISRDLLGADDLNASAHYLMALCSEHAGDAAGAVEHDRAAIYLDGTFAMPHLHLGCLAKRASDWITARSELQRAATLLLREDAPRILLFGGGFGREALLAFSRAELSKAGGCHE